MYAASCRNQAWPWITLAPIPLIITPAQCRSGPDRAARLDLRSLARFNYSSTGRQKAADEVEHRRFIRAEVVRQIEQRRELLIANRDFASVLLDVLENAYSTWAIKEPELRDVEVRTLKITSSAHLNRRNSAIIDIPNETTRPQYLELARVENDAQEPSFSMSPAR